jgi:hypothetical protein
MADVKISGLPASTVPLAGTEVLPIVQGGQTKQVSVNNLTAGKTVLATAFDTDVAAAGATLSGTTLAADGTDTNINLAITPKGSGGLGINGSPTGDLAGSTLTAKFCVKQDESGPVAGFVKANNSAATPGATVYGCRSRGTLAAPTIVQNNDVLATYLGLGFDGTDLAIAADIEFQVDGTPGSDDMPGRILFKTTPDGTQTPVEAMRIDSAQNVTLATGNLVIGTSGKGIDFSATAGTGTSELLADYEEGVWTPTLTTSSTDFTSVTYDANTGGQYVRVGNVVHIQCWVQTDAVTVGSASGDVAIGGLPFSVVASSAGINGTSAIAISFTVNWTTNNPCAAMALANTSRVGLFKRTTANGNMTDMAVADVGTGANNNFIVLGGTYVCA